MTARNVQPIFRNDDEPERDDRLANYADTLFERYLDDMDQLTAVALRVITDDVCTEGRLDADFAATLIGHRDDQDARDLRFMRELREKVLSRLREWAESDARDAQEEAA